MAMGNLYVGTETETCAKVTGTLEGEQKPRPWSIRSALSSTGFNGILNSEITVKSLKLAATTSSGHLVYTMKASYARADNTSLP